MKTYFTNVFFFNLKGNEVGELKLKRANTFRMKAGLIYSPFDPSVAVSEAL